MTMYIKDLQHISLRHKRYDMPSKDEDWYAITRRWLRMSHRVAGSSYRWYVVTFTDDRQELVYLTVKKAYFYRGIIFRRMLPYWCIKNIRLAF